MELKHIDVIQGQTALLQDFWSGIGRPERENNPDMSVCHERDGFKEREKMHVYTFKSHLILDIEW